MASATKSIFRMIPEIKAFLDSPLTKSLNAQITRDDFPHNEVIYTLTNGAMDLKMIVHSTLGQDDTYSLQIYTKPSEKTLEIRPDGDAHYSLFCQIHQLKDIKEIINELKQKFFPFI